METKLLKCTILYGCTLYTLLSRRSRSETKANVTPPNSATCRPTSFDPSYQVGTHGLKDHSAALWPGFGFKERWLDAM